MTASRHPGAAPGVVELDDWVYWSRGRARSANSASAPISDESRQPLRVAPVPRRGPMGRHSGRAACLPQPAVWRATTASAAGIYPWLVADPMPPVGAPIGYDVFSKSTFSSHPVEWVDRGIITNPNLYITGEPEEIALAHLYLMQNRYVTGTVLTVDGGLLLAG